MPEQLTRADLDALGDRLEKRFDSFELHFDNTMTAIRATLDEIHEAVSEERRREIARVHGALLELAKQTGQLDEVARLLQA